MGKQIFKKGGKTAKKINLKF